MVAPPALKVASASARARWLPQVDPGGGLVEHQQVGLAGQRAGDEDALLLPAAQLGHAEARAVGQPDDVDRVGDRPPVLAGEWEEAGAAG